MIPTYTNMATPDRTRGPQPDPSQTDCMRDPEYVMRGYKAALFDRSASHPDNPDLPPDPQLTARLEDMTEEDRHRARMGLGGPPYDPATVRSARASEDLWRRESGGGEKR